jgi:hypothetical protein
VHTPPSSFPLGGGGRGSRGYRRRGNGDGQRGELGEGGNELGGACTKDSAAGRVTARKQPQPGDTRISTAALGLADPIPALWTAARG